MSLIELEHVVKRYGDVVAVEDFHLGIDAGEFVVFVGPSGCGKSTTLRMMAGLEEISEGRLRIDGEDRTHTPPSLRGFSMVFQDYALYPHFTVRENMALGLRIQGIPDAEIATRVDEAAAMLKLGPLMERHPGALSGGQQQRVAIGRAMVKDPVAFLLDEPLSNLDAKLRGEMRRELSRLFEKQGRPFVYVTHDQIEAMTLATKIVVLSAGRMQQVGAPMDLYDAPANRFVAGFLGTPSMNFLPLDRGESGWRTARGAPVELPDPAGHEGELVLGVRPEHLIPRPGPEAPLRLTGVLERVEATGNLSFLHVEFEDGVLVAAVDPKRTRELAKGQPLELGLALEDARLFRPGEFGERLRLD